MPFPGPAGGWKEENLFSLLLLPPIMRAFVSLIFAGASFPLVGVMVLRMNLMQLRYTLMHGLLLGAQMAAILIIRILRNYDNVFMQHLAQFLHHSSFSRTGTAGNSYYQHALHRLKFSRFGSPGERYYISDIGHAGNKQQQPFES